MRSTDRSSTAAAPPGGLVGLALLCVSAPLATAQVGSSPAPVPGVVAGPPPIATLDFVPVTTGPVDGPLELRVSEGGSGLEFGGPRRFVDVQLLGIELCGRNELDSTLPGRARRRLDSDTGRSWIELPGGVGTVHRYRRRVGTEVRYGFLHIAGSTGRPRLVLERTSPTGGEVFVGKLAVSTDGGTLLVATLPGAGGDLFLAPVTAGRARELTSHIGPRSWSADGLWLGSGWGFAVEPGGPWRFAPDGDAVQVQAASAGTLTWTGQAVMDDRRRFGLATATDQGFGDRAFVIGATGAARAADTVPGTTIRPAGFQPEHQGGPFMAVNADGTLAAWTETRPPAMPGGDPIRDVRLARVDQTPATVLLTRDDLLIDTLTEIVRLHFAGPSDLSYGAGEPNDPAEGGAESVDLFRARLDPAGAPLIENVSRTSGATVPPFTGVPTLTPARAYRLSGGRLLLHDDDAASVLTLDLLTGARTHLDVNVKELLWLESAGAGFVGAVRRDVQPRPHDLLFFDPAGPSVSTLQQGSPTTRYVSRTSRDGWFAWRREDVPGQGTLHRVNSSTLAVETFTGPLSTLAGPFRLGRSGAVSFADGGFGVRSWRGSGGVVPLGPGLVLP